MAKKKKRHPVGDVSRKPIREEDAWRSVELDCRDGEHPASEISEHAFRRGFHQGVYLLELLLTELSMAEAARIAKETAALAYRMRYDEKPHPNYMHEMRTKLAKKWKLSQGAR